MTRRVHLLSSTADMGFTVQQVRPGYAGSEVWVREEELDRLRKAAGALAKCVRYARDMLQPESCSRFFNMSDEALAALAALDGEDGE